MLVAATVHVERGRGGNMDYHRPSIHGKKDTEEQEMISYLLQFCKRYETNIQTSQQRAIGRLTRRSDKARQGSSFAPGRF